jgi:hypothetical protein
MKTKILFLLLLMLPVVMNAHDFSVPNADGKTIYYDAGTDGGAIVTYRGGISYANVYAGDLVIPASVVYAGKTYNVTAIGKQAFKSCETLTSLTIPESITSIEANAFSRIEINDADGCPNLREFIVSEHNANYAAIDGILFSKDKTVIAIYPRAKTSAYTIPDGVTSIGTGAFSGCRMTSVIIPNSVISIESWAFNHSRLKNVTIGQNVISIGSGAFAECGGLEEIYNHNPVPQSIEGNVFNSLYSGQVDKNTCKLYVPEGSLDRYKEAEVWKDFVTIIADIPASVNAPSAANAVRAYFDPATGNIRIDGLTAPTSVIITDLSGRTVLQQTVRSEETIPAAHLPQGVYIVQINGKSMKIIK